MKIVLLRHGKPSLSNTSKIKAGKMAEWIESYNFAKLDLACQPKNESIEIVKNSGKIVCRNLPRSIESAQILYPSQ